MGKIFTLSADVKAIAQQAIDDMIAELGKDCRLIYPPRMVPCVNCVFDPIGKKSSNRWLSGGPIPFPNSTLCPLCSGQGLRAEEVTDTVRLLVAWDPKTWYVKRLPLNVQLADGMIQTKGFLSDASKILQAREMVVETPIESFRRYRFVLAGEPVDASNIIQGRYCVMTWHRQGG